MVIEAYKIFPGWNNAASLVNVESITPSPAPTKYLNDLANGNYAANTSYVVYSTPISENRLMTPGGGIQNGFTRQDWVFALISDDALKYWRATYTGKFTIATKIHDVYDTFSNVNAILDKPFAALESRFFECETWWFENVTIPVYIVGAAS
jgi:hypothetical protein